MAMRADILNKLKILTDAAKYDVSCASSGTGRGNRAGHVGNTDALGVCHAFAADGRCISLLKVLLSNHCRYDCAYCVNRRSNDLPRASFTPGELAELTIAFYRRNYIEGLFLSSAVSHGPDQTMEHMLATLRLLRGTYGFNGYVHMKAIPGASRELVRLAGLLADRLSVNIEIPSEANLKRLAPEKDHASVYKPMLYIRQAMEEHREDGGKFRHAPQFAPAGQSTQIIVGASHESDRDILRLASLLYRGPGLKRVYFSGYIPVNTRDARLPALPGAPLAREHRLYQADWLMRFYHFEAEEILEPDRPDLEPDMDPKLAWALRHPEFFPLDVNRAEPACLLRVPGLGPLTVRRIIQARRLRTLLPEHVARMGAVMKRARYFLAFPAQAGVRTRTIRETGAAHVRRMLSGEGRARPPRQYGLFDIREGNDARGCL
jgi:putative DNA modification/repair radical SAM protein